MNIPKKLRKKHYRIWYELLCESQRIFAKEASLTLGVDQRTASARLKESREEQYIVGPEIRKMAYSNFPEHVYFLDCDDPDLLYQKYRKDENIIFHALMYGFANLWVISKEKIDIEGDIIVEGLRSDYYVAFAPNHSWDDAIQIIRKKIQDFDPKEYEPKGYIKTHFGDTVEWSETDKILYRYFKDDLRKPFAPVMDEYEICTYTLYKWLERLPECCTIATFYSITNLNSLNGTVTSEIMNHTKSLYSTNYILFYKSKGLDIDGCAKRRRVSSRVYPEGFGNTIQERKRFKGQNKIISSNSQKRGIDIHGDRSENKIFFNDYKRLAAPYA